MEDERAIACLEPLLTEARRERMRSVLAARSDHVAFVFEHMIDPHNLSAALRSLDAFSFQDVHLVRPGERLGVEAGSAVGSAVGSAPDGSAPDGSEGRVARGITIGADRWLSLIEAPDIAACFAGLRQAGYTVLASDLEAPGAVSLTEIDFTRRTALVYGNEHLGVSPDVRAQADGAFRIDTLGFVQSLNLSVAVAISAFHARQQIARLATQARAEPQAERLHLSRARQRALYAQWLRGSVKHAERILAEARSAP